MGSTNNLRVQVSIASPGIRLKFDDMPKRKAKDVGETEEPRRSSRRISTKPDDAAPEPSAKVLAKKAKKASKKGLKAPEGDEPVVNFKDEQEPDSKPIKPVKKSKSTTASTAKAKAAEVDGPTGRQYWLLKAEPESRIEKGKDIKFSIDDLAAKTEPEPWDGIRNFAARNNLRAMKKGDLAFFYHSSCKVPAIVGTMEIVQEHTPDLTAPFYILLLLCFMFSFCSVLCSPSATPSALFYVFLLL